MFDLLYEAAPYMEELKKLFPTALIQDASDEVHEERLSVEVSMDEEEYWRILTLNGFSEMSLNIQTSFFYNTDPNAILKFEELIKKWNNEYPEYFKQRIIKEHIND